MRRRLLVVYLLMFATALVAVAVPYTAATAARDTQTVFIGQLNDTARFASLAEPALRNGESVTLQAELRRYDELFGVSAAVLDINGEVQAASRPSLSLTGERVRQRTEAGLAGERSGFDRVIWPWQDDPLVLAEPVGRGGEVIGVVVTEAPTDALRAGIIRHWALVGAAGGSALALAALAAVALTRWTLRPVRDLDAAAHRITAGDLDSRVPANTGPAELRQLTNSFNRMADTVTGTLTQQRAFVAQASHQLRTPLGVLRLRVENLGVHLRPGGQREHSRTLAETVRLSGILNSMLALARAEGGRHEVRETDAGRLVRDRVTAWEPMAAELGVRLQAGGGAPPVLAAPEALEQAVDALIDNALKYGSAGAMVLVHLTSGPDTAEIHVVDRGPGLEAPDRARATERFWRSPAHQNVTGCGLGLSVVEALMAACGGELILCAAAGGGLDARLRLRLSGGAGQPVGATPCGSPGSTAPPRDAAPPDKWSRPPADSAGAPPDAPRPARPAR